MIYGRDKSKSPRSVALMLDILHITVGIAVIILAVFAFLNPEGYRFLFPFIFLLAAVLHGVNGAFQIRDSGRNRKKRVAGILILMISGVLLVFCILSAISVWR